ncbi:hypothetical protein AB0F05_33455 [Streptomyces microflavus]|uniref:hypothetical protein n=1 Tax=Streptomyces microflavus TaxID=1919 RepID=UPI0033F183AE
MDAAEAERVTDLDDRPDRAVRQRRAALRAPRQADVYVFGVHTARTNDEYNALDVDQWKFYVLSAPQIMTLPRDRNDRACATLLRVQERTQAVIYTELAATVGEAATRQ